MAENWLLWAQKKRISLPNNNGLNSRVDLTARSYGRAVSSTATAHNGNGSMEISGTSRIGNTRGKMAKMGLALDWSAVKNVLGSIGLAATLPRLCVSTELRKVAPYTMGENLNHKSTCSSHKCGNRKVKMGKMFFFSGPWVWFLIWRFTYRSS